MNEAVSMEQFSSQVGFVADGRLHPENKVDQSGSIACNRNIRWPNLSQVVRRLFYVSYIFLLPFYIVAKELAAKPG